MDVHTVPGVNARDVAQAHRMDLLIQDEHDCKCITYWIDEERETIFCLIEAPTMSAVNEMHGRSHGLIPNKVIEVSSDLVGSFLGRIYDPLDAEITDDGLKVFKDPSFRVVLVVKTVDPTILKYKFGEDKAIALLDLHYSTIRKNLKTHDGREVEEKGSTFISSFTSAAKAMNCALEIQEKLYLARPEWTGFKIAIDAGEPVSNSDELFGDTIQLAHYMCAITKKFPIVISSAVDELIAKDFLQDRGKKILSLSPHDEGLLRPLFNILEQHWTDPAFNVSDLGRSLAMSKSQLYRKTTALCGLSPILLLKNFRLEKAKDLIKRQRSNISGITFESGFSSPSYFTKCFKKKYGLLPMAYLDLLR